MPIKSTVAKATAQQTMKRGDLYVAERTRIVVMVTAAPMNPPAAKTFAGVVMNSGLEKDQYPIGFSNDDWVIEAFKPFYGTLTLESTP